MRDFHQTSDPWPVCGSSPEAPDSPAHLCDCLVAVFLPQIEALPGACGIRIMGLVCSLGLYALVSATQCRLGPLLEGRDLEGLKVNGNYKENGFSGGGLCSRESANSSQEAFFICIYFCC